jgi:hypothetical protein
MIVMHATRRQNEHMRLFAPERQALIYMNDISNGRE